jgi:hypothetical protein
MLSRTIERINLEPGAVLSWLRWEATVPIWRAKNWLLYLPTAIDNVRNGFAASAADECAFLAILFGAASFGIYTIAGFETMVCVVLATAFLLWINKYPLGGGRR